MAEFNKFDIRKAFRDSITQLNQGNASIFSTVDSPRDPVQEFKCRIKCETTELIILKDETVGQLESSNYFSNNGTRCFRGPGSQLHPQVLRQGRSHCKFLIRDIYLVKCIFQAGPVFREKAMLASPLPYKILKA